MMYENTVYLVTGANRGIGLAMVTMLLQRPHTTVIATSRRPPPQEHSASSATSIPDELPAHATSTLVQVLLNDSDATISSATLHGRLRDTHNIARLDVVVANAGSSSGFHDILATDPDFDLLHDFVVNAAGPAKLFRAVWPLLDPEVSGARGGVDDDDEEEDGGGQRRTKFVLITSSLGSIGCLDEESMPSTAYGMSKAAANWFAKKLSVEFRDRGLLVGIIHPGFVKTSMGQAVADAIGMKEPPMSVEDSAKGVIEQIDTLTPEKSGQFLRFDGGKMPW